MIEGSLLAGRPLLLRSDEPSANATGTEADNASRDDEVGDGKCYRLISINASHAPDGCTGGDWFVYRIAQGGNDITGYRRGSSERVNADVQCLLASLNGRRNWTKSKGALDRQRRAAAAARRAAK